MQYESTKEYLAELDRTRKAMAENAIVKDELADCMTAIAALSNTCAAEYFYDGLERAFVEQWKYVIEDVYRNDGGEDWHPAYITAVIEEMRYGC